MRGSLVALGISLAFGSSGQSHAHGGLWEATRRLLDPWGLQAPSRW